MPTTDTPTKYTSPVAAFRTGAEADDDTYQLARIYHARSTKVGVGFDDLDEGDRVAVMGGIAHVVNAISEALRPTFGADVHAEVRKAIEASFSDGDCAEILRHAESSLSAAIADDDQFRARAALQWPSSDGTAPPPGWRKPGVEKETVGDKD